MFNLSPHYLLSYQDIKPHKKNSARASFLHLAQLYFVDGPILQNEIILRIGNFHDRADGADSQITSRAFISIVIVSGKP